MPTCLIGKAGSGIHHGQRRKLHQQAEYIAADPPHPDSLLAIGRRTIHCPEGVPCHSLPRRLERICGRGPRLAMGQESAPRRGEKRIHGRRACGRRAGMLLARHAERRQKGPKPDGSLRLFKRQLYAPSRRCPAQNCSTRLDRPLTLAAEGYRQKCDCAAHLRDLERRMEVICVKQPGCAEGSRG